MQQLFVFTLVGIPISFVLLAIFVGGVANAFLIMVVSIICTAGTSLLLWVPAWMLLGWIALGLTKLLLAATGVGVSHQPTNLAQELVSPQLQLDALAEYIQKAQAKGKSIDEINQILKDQGWTETEIGTAFQTATAQSG